MRPDDTSVRGFTDAAFGTQVKGEIVAVMIKENQKE
jgi:hypothetical protein